MIEAIEPIGKLMLTHFPIIILSGDHFFIHTLVILRFYLKLKYVDKNGLFVNMHMDRNQESLKFSQLRGRAYKAHNGHLICAKALWVISLL